MDTWEKQYQEDGFESQRRYPSEALIRFLANHFFSVKNRKMIKILEIGCGSGANLWMIAQENFNAYGIDSSQSGIQLCRQMLNNWGVEANISMGDMCNLNFKDEYFDCIVDVVSMQHLDIAGHKLSYKEVFRCLKNNGYFFQWHFGQRSTSWLKSNGKKVDDYTLDYISDPTKPLLDIPFNTTGLSCFLTKEMAKKLLRDVGFADIIIEATIRTYKNMTQQIEYLDISAQKII